MQNLAKNIEDARKQLLFQHNPQCADGWITLARKDPHTRKFLQRHYQPEELAESLSEWTGEDVYYSQNSFFKPQRRIDNIRQLRSLYVDMDVYNLNLTPEWVLGKLEHEYFREVMPEPNMVIFSGRGLVLVWNIDPIPYQAMPLWRSVENYLIDMLKDLGADMKASDPARIFRLAGTVNSKNKTTVTAQYRHGYRYDIHELQYDYLPELTPKPQKKRGRKPKIIRLFNTYTLHLVRARDVAKLVRLRDGDVRNHREYICFLYRYFTCCYTNDPVQALEYTLSLNDEFTEPLSRREVITATKSAEKAWNAKSDAKANELAKSMGYPGAGYLLTNKKIIDWLDITPDEQREMETIIGAGEKRRRNTIAKREARRSQGVKPRDEYLSEAERKRQAIRKAIINHPSLSVRALAEKTGFSKSAIQRVKTTI
jgi:hypothetical protein